jgi:hypothetical protein
MSVATAAPDDDPFLIPGQLSARAIYKQCEKSRSNAEKANCLDRIEQRLRIDLKGKIAKKLIEIDAIADVPPTPSELSGKDTAARWRRDFLAAQTAWEAYNARQCQNVVDYDYYGGNSGGISATACNIRHVVARINEITE